MITVKGKRRARNPSINLCTTQPQKRGRPLKPKSDLKVPRNIVNAHLQQYHNYAQQTINKIPTATLSSLESLPNELIQYIFFLCLEINLPRASTHLADTLSTESTYRALLLLAYFHEEEEWPVDVKFFRPAPYKTLSLEDRTALQAGIVECRWFTLDRLQSCLPTLKWLRLAQSWHREHHYITTDAATKARAKGLRVRTEGDTPTLAQLPDIKDQAEVEKYFQSRSIQPDEVSTPTAQSCRIGAHMPYFSVTMTTCDSNKSYVEGKDNKHLSILDARIVPAWLVRGGPWTDEKIELLQLLRQGSICGDVLYAFEVCQTAVIKGIESAIREQNIAALTTLLELRAAYGEGIIQSSYTCSISEVDEPLPFATFHLATRQQPHSSALIWLLTRASIESIRHDDAILTRWALKTSLRPPKCPIAFWLIKYMDGCHDYDYEEQIFEMGSWTHSVHRVDLPPELERPEARCFDEDLGYQY